MNIIQPNRVTRTYTQQLVAKPSVVFPLLCPVRETDTSLGPGGDACIASFTEAYYHQFMQDWETRLNRYLLRGRSSWPGG